MLRGVINDADHPHATGDVWGPVRINHVVQHNGGEAANVGDGRLSGLVQVSEQQGQVGDVHAGGLLGGVPVAH